jgi:hypothetical protein
MSIIDLNDLVGNQSTFVWKFCSVGNGKFKVILSYFQLMDSLKSQEDGEGNVWEFSWTTGHQCPLLQNDKDYNGSPYNVMIEWENGEIAMELLSVIVKDDPITYALCACSNNFLELEGWQQLKSNCHHSISASLAQP